MARYTYAVEHTGRPFGPNEPIPEDAWEEYSRHTSLAAATRAYHRAVGEMKQRCNPYGGSLCAWDDHFRIVDLTHFRGVDLTW